ncbi:MAG: cysteine desulfurase [Cyclobacteriaceae bacterium]|nr:MAG: cysteine desulfurase [Cyclobacteriaceae bacterium]
MQVYLDNAATTPLDPEVFEAMKPYLLDHFGNPSSIHSHGRQVRSAIEQSRRTIADLLNTSPAEIFFTSGGTEADNTAILCTVESSGLNHVITSRIEHHAVLHTVQHLEKAGKITVSYVQLDNTGNVDLQHLKQLLLSNGPSLVTLMHANNEIGNLTDISAVGELCKEHHSIFHSDTVQAMAHYPHDLQKIEVHCLAGSAHKFHGPKGIGFMYLKADHKICPFVHGGAQERNMRGGTENVTGIVGLAKALELAYQNMEEHQRYIQGLKTYMIDKLSDTVPGVTFNGLSSSPEGSLYTVLNVSLPATNDNEMLLFNLDINGVSASGGSACSSGTSVGSHVLTALGGDPNRGSVRFSFSKFNTIQEIDYVVQKLGVDLRSKV